MINMAKGGRMLTLLKILIDKLQDGVEEGLKILLTDLISVISGQTALAASFKTSSEEAIMV